MALAGWAPPGVASDPKHWRYDMKQGWLEPGAMGSIQGTQLHMPPGFDPKARGQGWQMVVSPPGVPAPVGALNYTPATREVHAPGIPAPVDQMNLSALPAGQAPTSPPPATGAGSDSGPYLQGTYTDDLARQLAAALGDWSSSSPGMGQDVGVGADEEDDLDGFGGGVRTHITPGQVTPTAPNESGSYPPALANTVPINPDNPTPMPPVVQGAADAANAIGGGVAGAAAGAYGAAASIGTSGTAPSVPAPSPAVQATVNGPSMTANQPAPPSTSLPPINRSGNPAQFYASVMPYARQFEAQTGVPAQIAAAMAASESNYGRAPGNMLFGVKYTGAPGTHSTGPLPTWESVNGQRVNTTAEFEAFDTPQAAFQGLGRTLSQPIYADAMKHTNDPETFIRMLNGAGYATDPNWHANISSMARQALAAEGASGSTSSPSTSGNTNLQYPGAYNPRPSEIGMTLRDPATTLIPYKDEQGNVTRWGIPDPAKPGSVATNDQGEPLTFDVNPRNMHMYNSNGHVYMQDLTHPDQPAQDLGTSDAARSLALDQQRFEVESRISQQNANTNQQNANTSQQQVNQPSMGFYTDGSGQGWLYNTKGGNPVKWGEPGNTIKTSPDGSQVALFDNRGTLLGTQDLFQRQAERPQETRGGGMWQFDREKNDWVQTTPNLTTYQVFGTNLYQLGGSGERPVDMGPVPQGSRIDKDPVTGATRLINVDTGEVRELQPGRRQRETINGKSVSFDESGNPRVDYADNSPKQMVLGGELVEYDPATKQYRTVARAPRQPISLGGGKWLIPQEMKIGGRELGPGGNAYMGTGQYGETPRQGSGWDVSGPSQGANYNAFSAPGQGQDVGSGAAMPMPSAPLGGPAEQPPTGWTPPVPAQDVVGTGNRFGQPVDMEGIHKGLDFQAVQGTPAVAPADGTVVAVQNKPDGLGQQVLIRDADGQIHTLSHLDTIDVKEGDTVRTGQPVGTVGSTGAGSTGPHMDYRVQGPEGEYRDPTQLAGPLAQMPTVNKAPVGTGGSGWNPHYDTSNAFQALGNIDGFGGGPTDYYGEQESQAAPTPNYDPYLGSLQTPQNMFPGAGTTTPAATTSPYQGALDQSLYGPNTQQSPGPSPAGPGVSGGFPESPSPSPTGAPNLGDPGGYNPYGGPAPSANMQQQALGANSSGATSGYGSPSYNQGAQQAAQLELQKQQLGLQQQSMQQQFQQAKEQLDQQWAIHRDDLAYQQQLAQLQDQWRAADRALTSQQNELNRQMQLLVQGSEAQREEFALSQSALKNPWLQQLTGMAPGWKQPGGPGAPKNPTNGIVNPQGWIPNQGITGAGQDVGVGSAQAPTVNGVYGGGTQSGINLNQPPLNPYATPPSYDPYAAQGLSSPSPANVTASLTSQNTGGGAVDSPTTSGGSSTPNYNPTGNIFGSVQPAAQPSGVLNDPYGLNSPWAANPGGWYPELAGNPQYMMHIANLGVSGQQVPFQAKAAYGSWLSSKGIDPSVIDSWNWGPDPSLGGSGAGGLSVPALPSLPSWDSYLAMTPFQRAALRTTVETTGTSWEEYINQMREKWANEGGPTQAPDMTALAAARQTPRDYLNNSQIAESFGNTTQEYWNQQAKGWSPAAASSVSLVA